MRVGTLVSLVLALGLPTLARTSLAQDTAVSASTTADPVANVSATAFAADSDSSNSESHQSPQTLTPTATTTTDADQPPTRTTQDNDGAPQQEYEEPFKWPFPHSNDKVFRYLKVGPLPDCWRRCMISEGVRSKTYMLWDIDSIGVYEFCVGIWGKGREVRHWMMTHLQYCLRGYDGHPGECRNRELANDWFVGLCGNNPLPPWMTWPPGVR